jgi:hypothetical protein
LLAIADEHVIWVDSKRLKGEALSLRHDEVVRASFDGQTLGLSRRDPSVSRGEGISWFSWSKNVAMGEEVARGEARGTRSTSPLSGVADVTMFSGLLRREREPWGLYVAQGPGALWGQGNPSTVSSKPGERWPSFDTYDRICKLFGWPQTFSR